MTGPNDGWAAVPFWSLYRRVKRVGYPSEQLLSVYRDYGVIRKADRDDNMNRPGEDLSAYQLVEPGDLVLNKMKTWQGSLGISPHRGIVSPAYFVYSARSSNEPRFLHLALRSRHYIEKYAQISKGIRPNQWDLQPEKLDAVMVSLPPLDEQRRIAGYLDREMSEIDAMEAELDRLVNTLGERRGVIAHDALARPSDCEEQPLWSFLAPVKDQGHPDEQVLSVYRDHGVIPKDSRDDNRNQTPQNLSNYQLVQPGDVVINKMKAWQGSLGVSAHRGIVSPDYQVCRPLGSGVGSRYLHLVLRSPQMIPQYGVRSKGIRPSQWRLYWEDMAPLVVPVPPLDEQRRIVADLDEQTAQIDAMIADAERLKRLLAERRSTLITDVVTGKKEVPA